MATKPTNETAIELPPLDLRIMEVTIIGDESLIDIAALLCRSAATLAGF